jgi:hypothetical protein
VDKEPISGAEGYKYDFECEQYFARTEFSLRIEDDGDVAWAYLVRPGPEICYLVWFYNVCPKREVVSKSRTGMMVLSGADPVGAANRVSNKEDVQCFGVFAGDGADIVWMIVCLKGKMCGLIQRGRQIAYGADFTVDSGGVEPLPAVVWAKVPQELTMWAEREGCELVSFDI